MKAGSVSEWHVLLLAQLRRGPLQPYGHLRMPWTDLRSAGSVHREEKITAAAVG